MTRQGSSAASSLKDTQTFFLRLCTDVDFDENKLPHWVSPETARHLLAQDRERLLIYRRLTANGAITLLEEAYPILFAMLPRETHRGLVRGFLAAKIRSNRYRHIASEFHDFLKSAPEPHGVPACWRDVAAHERVRFELIFAPSAPAFAKASAEDPLESVTAVLNPALGLEQYEFPVHEIGSTSDFGAVKPRETTLVSLRRPGTYEIRSFAVNGISARLVAALTKERGSPLAGILDDFLSQENVAATQVPAFVNHLIAEGIVLGLAPAAPAKERT